MAETANPDRYRKLLEPFESMSEYEEACKKFYDGWSKLREECGLPDVVCIICAPVQFDVVATQMMGLQTCGSHLMLESMTAFAYGRAQESREHFIAEVIAGETKTKRTKKSLFSDMQD